jgi:hypothetical protein
MLTDFEITVRNRMIEGAYTELRQMVSGCWPGSPSTFWPEFGLTPQEVREMLRERHKDRINTREVHVRPDPPTSHEIDRADECATWRALVTNPVRRRMLVRRMQCYATGRSWSAECRRQGWVKRTAERYIDAAIKEIAASLCKKEVFVTSASKETVSQLAPKSGYKVDTVAMNAA